MSAPLLKPEYFKDTVFQTTIASSFSDRKEIIHAFHVEVVNGEAKLINDLQVKKNDKIIHSSNSIQLAIKAYNNC